MIRLTLPANTMFKEESNFLHFQIHYKYPIPAHSTTQLFLNFLIKLFNVYFKMIQNILHPLLRWHHRHMHDIKAQFFIRTGN